MIMKQDRTENIVGTSHNLQFNAFKEKKKKQEKNEQKPVTQMLKKAIRHKNKDDVQVSN